MISKNGVGILLMFMSFIGLETDEDTLTHFISAIGTCISFFLMMYHQVIERPEVHNFLFKKIEDV